jgi:very-short-patch-repair endonuclease
VAQALLDYAATAPLKEVRWVLSEAEFKGLLRLDAIDGVLGRGRRGSAKLRLALRRHDPRLGRTKSEVERERFRLCESGGVPVPETNARLGLQTVDGVWWEQKVTVEVDGGRGHWSRAQRDRDHRRDLHKRALGFVPLRYSEYQVFYEGDLVLADIKRTLGIAP